MSGGQTLSLKNPGNPLRDAVNESVKDLETALALKVGVMDSDSKREAVEAKRMDIVNRVLARLREA